MLKEAAIHFCQFEEPHFSNRTCRIEESVTIYHGPSVSVIANIIGNIKFGLLVSFLVLSYSAQVFLVKLLPEYLQFFQQFEKRLMVLDHWQHNTRMYIFSDETYFANGVSINSLFWIPVLFFCLRRFFPFWPVVYFDPK